PDPRVESSLAVTISSITALRPGVHPGKMLAQDGDEFPGVGLPDARTRVLVRTTRHDPLAVGVLRVSDAKRVTDGRPAAWRRGPSRGRAVLFQLDARISFPSGLNTAVQTPSVCPRSVGRGNGAASALRSAERLGRRWRLDGRSAPRAP